MKLLPFTTSLLVLPTVVVQSGFQEMSLKQRKATSRTVDPLPTAIPTLSLMSLSRLVVWMNKTVKTIYYFFKNDKIFFCTNNFPYGVNFPKPMGNLFLAFWTHIIKLAYWVPNINAIYPKL